MKKQLFSFLMMLALVIVAGSAEAQSSYSAPYVGAEQIYKWSAVTAASYSYAVTTSNTSPSTAVVAPTTIYSVSTGSLAPSGGLAAASSADLGIKWLAGSVGTTYYVWLVATSADGCVNWRYVTVVPEVNKVDFVLTALGLYTKAEAIASLNAATAKDGGNDCPTPSLRDGAIYDSNGSTDDGDVYAYYRVSQGTDNNPDTWTFAFSSNIGTVEYYNGTAWVAYSAALTARVNGSVQLLRVMIPTPIATDAVKTITGTISAASEETTGLADSDSGNDVQSFTVNRVAAIGGFSGN
jgi:hypothetical protein